MGAIVVNTLQCYISQPTYLNHHLLAHDPFRSLDLGGVGGMIQMAVRRIRRADHRVKVIYLLRG